MAETGSCARRDQIYDKRAFSSCSRFIRTQNSKVKRYLRNTYVLYCTYYTVGGGGMISKHKSALATGNFSDKKVPAAPVRKGSFCAEGF